MVKEKQKTVTYAFEVTGWKAGLILGLAVVGFIESICQLITIAMLPFINIAMHTVH